MVYTKSVTSLEVSYKHLLFRCTSYITIYIDVDPNPLQAEDLMIAKEKIISQKQKIENLEAIISMKTDHEK